MSMFTRAYALMSATLVQAKGRRDEKGATAVEYGLLVALIAAVIVAAVALLGTEIDAAFDTISEKLADPADADAGGNAG